MRVAPRPRPHAGPPPAQVIRASIPVLVAILAICIEARVPSKSEVVCLVIISLGVMLAVWEESRNAVLGACTAPPADARTPRAAAVRAPRGRRR